MATRTGRFFRRHGFGLIAIFIALGGTAYALQANSVKSRHIVDGQVKSSDIQDNGVGGVDILEDSLGQVPSAANADLLDNLNSTDFLGVDAKAANSDKLDNLDSTDFARAQGANFTDAGLPPLPQPNCSGMPDGWYDWAPGAASPVSYWRDPFGIVHLRGVAHQCVSEVDQVGGDVFQLPPGYRAKLSFFAVPAAFSRTVSDAVLYEDGRFVVNASSVGLDGISYRCAPSGENGCP